MKLSALFDNAPDIEIENLMVDSRDVLPNSIFFCIKGMIHDGHRYVNAAVKNGAVCVVHSEDIKRNNANVVYIKVRDVIAALNQDRKSTRLNSSHSGESRMPSSA